MTTTEKYIQTLTEARTRFANLLSGITEADLPKKVGLAKNSAGFLIRHIADVELLFAKNVFGGNDVKVHAKTVAAVMDTGEWTNLSELIDYQKLSFETLISIISTQSDEDWETIITTNEFGTKSKAEALGRIVSHTAYHAGQLALILKYGV
ncbi:MAG: DinB family protein [Bacteroidetes bacterium]|nr:DinB family protein [Bacteroidota bacterium]